MEVPCPLLAYILPFPRYLPALQMGHMPLNMCCKRLDGGAICPFWRGFHLPWGIHKSPSNLSYIAKHYPRSSMYPYTCIVNLYGVAIYPYLAWILPSPQYSHAFQINHIPIDVNFTFPRVLACPPDQSYTPKHLLEMLQSSPPVCHSPIIMCQRCLYTHVTHRLWREKSRKHNSTP